MQFFVEIGYFITAIIFIIALKRMSHPSTAQGGVLAAGWAMVFATVISLFHPEVSKNYFLIILAIAIGGGWAYRSALKVEMTDMPQMIAIYNGAGGGSAALIGAIALLQVTQPSADVSANLALLSEQAELLNEPTLAKSILTSATPSKPLILLAAIGGLIGAVSLTGSIVAWAKLDGRMRKEIRIKGRNFINLVLFGTALLFALIIASLPEPHYGLITLFFLITLLLGVLIAIPIGGADMPVIISLFNALTGIAVAFEGIALQNGGLIIAGTVVGAAGTLLTQLMAKGMNRSLSNVLFSNFGAGGGEAQEIEGSMKPVSAGDAATTMNFASKVIIVPGYGLAAAQAQHQVAEFTKLLQTRGIEVKFAIHPVAGRMPGHMNVLIAEAGIPYDLIFDLDEINDEFKEADAVVVIGANDVVNPAARTDESSPIFGMPILNADQAKQVFVVKRGEGRGFSGIENHLFYLDNTNMIYGDAKKVVADMITTLKDL